MGDRAKASAEVDTSVKRSHHPEGRTTERCPPAALPVARLVVETHLVGSSERVADDLGTLQRVTGADELIVTTITHERADRMRSYGLLAQHRSALRGVSQHP
jgi:alkanesulfonate monooxygenase SsuD/methylene tetrahydromethanopterin reductase-like flavin-dependent oxidoreductase (luciferase family)